jgi:putative Mg2+ transporter-C (MgtC) family protein
MEAFHPHLFGLVELVGAYLLALPIGWDREQNDRSMGLRTFPLIAVASCAFLVIAQRAMPNEPGEWNKVLEGVAMGVGFLGAGAIVKQGITVLGTATAAGVWMTAAMGAAAAFGQWPIAIALSAIGFGTLRLVRHATPEGKSTDRGDVLEDEETPAGREDRNSST